MKRSGDEREPETEAESGRGSTAEPGRVAPRRRLLEREEELHRIAAAISAASAGSGAILCARGVGWDRED